jgi:hypothetical protein
MVMVFHKVFDLIKLSSLQFVEHVSACRLMTTLSPQSTQLPSHNLFLPQTYLACSSHFLLAGIQNIDELGKGIGQLTSLTSVSLNLPFCSGRLLALGLGIAGLGVRFAFWVLDLGFGCRLHFEGVLGPLKFNLFCCQFLTAISL